MHISTVNISEMVADRADFTIVIKYDVALGLSIRIFRVDLVLF